MKIISILSVFCLVFLTTCKKEEDLCMEFAGTYSGTISGTIQGTLTLIINESGYLEGTWNGMESGSGTQFTGAINGSYIDCETGSVDYDYGVGLTGPMQILCPSSESYCYDTGATLGRFSGTISNGSGSGIWQANSGAAQTIGVLGNGAWSVTKN
jgi:hypothetical protein